MGGQELESPDAMAAFMELHKAGSTDGVLPANVKELIALSIAVTVRCDGCIAFHVHDAVAAGATHEEVVEMIGVAILMGGRPFGGLWLSGPRSAEVV